MYSVEIRLATASSFVKQILNKILEVIDYVPHSMDLFTNEFEKPKVDIPYNLDFINRNISDEELNSITAVSLYDQYFNRDSNITPFVRIKIKHNANANLELTIRFVSYQNLNRFINDDSLIKNFLPFGSFIYGYFYNQHDVFNQTKEKEQNTSWGKKIEQYGYSFMAAPLMYFGESFFKYFSFTELDKNYELECIEIDSQKIFKLELFELYSNSELNRKIQQEFWIKTQLEDAIMNYQKLHKPQIAVKDRYVLRVKKYKDLKKR